MTPQLSILKQSETFYHDAVFASNVEMAMFLYNLVLAVTHHHF